MGLPSLPARTRLAWSGPLSPSAATSSPDSPSWVAKLLMNAMCALKSCCAQLVILYGPPPGVFIISMYFIVGSFRAAPSIGQRLHPVVGAARSSSTSAIQTFDFFREAQEPAKPSAGEA